MRIGYSLSSSEIIAAEHAEYGDCAKYQIVCSNCREAVFKGARQSKNRADTHYFSHYRAGSDEARLCEMRVALLAQRHMGQRAFDTHGQTLSSFMSVLRDAIVDAQDALGVVSGAILRRDALRIMARPDIESLERPMRELFNHARSYGSDPAVHGKPVNHREEMAEGLAMLPIFAGRSPFWRRRQASYVMDIHAHLTTEQAASNFRFVVACSYSLLAHAQDTYAMEAVRIDEARLSHNVAVAVCEGKSPTIVKKFMLAYPRREIAKGYEAGVNAAMMSETECAAVSRILNLAAVNPKPPAGRSALLSSVGGQPFYDAAKIPLGRLKAAVNRRQAGLIAELADISAEKQNMEDARDDSLLRLGVLRLAASLWGPFTGLLAAVPYHQICAPKTVRAPESIDAFPTRQAAATP